MAQRRRSTSNRKPVPAASRIQGESATRERQLEEALAHIDKAFGRGAVMRMSDGGDLTRISVISTGCWSLDLALGIGGFPRGRVAEVYGPESSGKTTLTLHLIAEAQKQGGTCAFIDAEHALDINYARALGIEVEALLVSQPDSGEQALEIADILVRSGAVDLVVIDSVAALTPRAEIEGQMGDHHVGSQARLMSQALRKITAAAARTGTAVVFINQIRMKIGVTFGSPETTTGGHALKFYSSVRVDIRRIGHIKDSDKVVGNRTRIKVVKNKLAPPFRQTEVEIRFGRGICPWSDLVDQGIELGVLTRSGAWLSWGETRLGQGREAGRAWLRDHPDQVERLRGALCEGLGQGAEAAVG